VGVIPILDFGLKPQGVNLASGIKVPLWKDLGSTGKDASQNVVTNQPKFIDAPTDIIDGKPANINFNPVVKFVNDGTAALNQFCLTLIMGTIPMKHL
jgi:hypothetical protein